MIEKSSYVFSFLYYACNQKQKIGKQSIGTYSHYYTENSFWIVNIENLECTYLNGDKCRHFYVFKSFFIQCNYLLVRRYPTVLPTLYSNPRMPCRKHSRANKPLIPYSTNEYKLFTNDTSGIQKVPIYSIDGCSALTLIKLRALSNSYFFVSKYFLDKISFELLLFNHTIH